MRALFFGLAITTSVFAACGGSKSEPAMPSESTPPAATGDTAPGGVPGTPDQCCCELPDSRGVQLSASNECTATAGTCKPVVECNGSDAPKQ